MSKLVFIIKCVKCKVEFNQGEKTAVRLCEKCRVKNKNGVRKKRAMKKEMKVTTGRCRFCEKEFTIKNFTKYNPNRTKQYCSDTCRQKFYNISKSIKATKEQIERLQNRLNILNRIKHRRIK